MSLEMYEESKLPPICTIGIAAGKGGVGKSSFTVNLALALQKLGYKVGIMDTDLYGPSVRKMLPEDRLPVQKGQIFTPALCNGIKVISMAYFRKEDEAAAVRAPIANNIITSFIKNVDWGDIDYLLVDFPPGTGDIQLTLAQRANLSGAIMITTPQEVSLMDVRRAMHLFAQVKVPIIGVVENMSYYINPTTKQREYLFGKEGGRRLALEAGVPLLGQIPIDPIICQNGDRGTSLFASSQAEAKPIVENFINIANQVLSHLSILKDLTREELTHFELIWRGL